ncbi:apolipoprotein N-acyltransferase [soil metagenome]
MLSAALLPLCFPPWGWWPLILVVLPALILATTGTTSRRAFYLGMLHGLVGYGLALHWFFFIFGRAAFPLFAIMALFTGLFCLLNNYFSNRFSSRVLAVLVTPTLWTAIEFFRSELYFLRFPWITPGTALGPTYLSPILGVYGASFLVLAASAALVRRRTLPLAVSLGLGVLVLGLFRPVRLAPVEGLGVAVTVVQSEACVLPAYAALTAAAVATGSQPDLIVWPEYALPYDVRRSPGDLSALHEIAAESGAILIVGTKTVSDGGAGAWHNTALTLDENGILGEYYKARPVHFFDDGTPGDHFEPVGTRLGAVGTPICFDFDYSDVPRKLTRAGAEFFAVPTFDAESWSATQHLQHAALFRLRAAENARWVASAASSGVSQFVDPNGNVHGSLPPMVVGSLTSEIGRSTHLTFFTRAGWLFPWVTLGGTALLLVFGFLSLRSRGAEGSRPGHLLAPRADLGRRARG